MKVGTRRAWARAGAGVAAQLLTGSLVLTCALVGTGGPAQADPAPRADLSVSAAGTPLTTDTTRAKARPFKVAITNSGPHTAQNVVLEVDLAGLDRDLVGYLAPRGCRGSGQKYRCSFGPVASHGVMEFSVALYAKGGTGPAGSFAVSATSSTADPDRSNNSAGVQVEVVARSFDLVAVAFDVYADDDTEPVELLPVAPGHRAWLRWFAVNRGSGGSRGGGATRGVSYTVALPAHVTFAEHREGCAYSPDNRRMTCQDPDAVLARGTASGYVADPVRVVVDRLARGPVLVGGTVSAYALEQLTADAAARLGVAAGPRVKALTEAQQEQLAEAAHGGNAARYDVHVSMRQLAAGSGGGLPITGAQAGLAGLLGLAVLATGGVLLVMARRRRLVLVTPDERPPAR
ncbi:MAG TPA: hypothetical protein VFB84_18375 [Micromonosporaceae bacterium]|nr:hypothetical protein [Micromonosporaceae bacterium]